MLVFVEGTLGLQMAIFFIVLSHGVERWGWRWWWRGEREIISLVSFKDTNPVHQGSTLMTYHILPSVMCTHAFVPNFQEKKSFILVFNSIIYLYLETKLIIIFQGIILHMDIIIYF